MPHYLCMNLYIQGQHLWCSRMGTEHFIVDRGVGWAVTCTKQISAQEKYKKKSGHRESRDKFEEVGNVLVNIESTKNVASPPPPPLLNLDQPIVDELIMDIFLQLVIFLDENFPELKQVFEQHKVIYCKLFMTLMSWLK